MMNKKLILGSSSPRRAEILRFFSIPFEIHSPTFDEKSHPFNGEAPHYVQSLAEEKAQTLAHLCTYSMIVLTADTCVFKDGQAMNKPNDEDEALEMLRSLNGSWHSVLTGVTAFDGKQCFSTYAETKILFHSVSEAKLRTYHRAFHGLDKAGGYGIQQAGSVIVERIEGCFYNVMRLPLTSVVEVLEKAGIDLWDYLKPE